MPFLRRLLLLLLATGALASRASSQDVIGVDQVVEGDELRRLGITQLGEILRYVHGGRTTTIDGFSRRLSLNGLGSYHEAGPDVYVDGHPVELTFFGFDPLNLVGVPIEAIDRVEIVTKPALIYGTFAGRGAIHIHTRDEVEGVRADAALSVDSEVGDPGPFAYLDEVENTDTQGPNARALLEAGSETAGARVGGIFHRHYLTKPAILPRMLDLQHFSDAPIMEVVAPSASAAWGGSSFGANVLGLGLIGNLYTYLPHASKEISADYRAANVSGVLRHEITPRSAFRHRLSVSALRAHHPSASSVPFSWEEEGFTVNSAFGRSLDSRVVALGVTAGFERARGQTEANRKTSALYAAIAGRMSETVEYQGGGMIATDWTYSALKAYGGITVRPSPEHRGDLYLSIAEDLPHEQSGVDGWVQWGAEVPLLPMEVDREEVNVAIRASGDAEWSWTPNTTHAVAGGVGIRVAGDSYAFDRTIVPDGNGYRAAALSYSYVTGSNGVAWMEYVTRLLPGTQRLFWHVEATLGGDELYRQIWRAVPDARFGVFAYVPLAPDFQFEASLVRQTGSTWEEFEPVVGEAAEVSGSTLLDAAFYKRLLAGRVHVRLAFRNFLREEVRFHPIGDVFDLSARLDVRVEFRKSR